MKFWKTPKGEKLGEGLKEGKEIIFPSKKMGI